MTIHCGRVTRYPEGGRNSFLGSVRCGSGHIVGDSDGLVAVPQEHAEAILASAKAILVKEEGSMKQIRAGTVDRSWVDKALKEKGYKV